MYVTPCGNAAGDPTSRPLPRFELGGYDDSVSYVMESDTGDLGIAVAAALPVAGKIFGKIFGGGGPGGCTNAGPQQATRDIMQQIRTVNAEAFSKGLPIHEPTFAMLRGVASGADEQAYDCPELQVEVGVFLAEYDRNRVVAQAGVTSVVPTAPTVSTFGGLVAPGAFPAVPLVLAGLAGLVAFNLLGKK